MVLMDTTELARKPSSPKASDFGGGLETTAGADQSGAEPKNVTEPTKETLQCRICFEEQSGPKAEKAFISPCRCSGSQKYIHRACLRKWQETIIQNKDDHTKAYECGVCNALFTSRPPRICSVRKALCSRGSLPRALTAAAAAAAAAVLAALLPSPRALLTGAGLLLLAGLGVPSALLSSRGLALTWVGGGWALVRRGAPVPGLGPGRLLVAREGAVPPGSVFHRSVVLLLEYSPGGGGARGVVLTAPDTVGRDAAAARRRLAALWGRLSSPEQQLRVGTGGPVARGGTGQLPGAVTVLHNRSGLQGSHEVSNGIYCARNLESLLETENDEGSEDTTTRASVLFGYAGWAPRQLDGEIRAGGWRVLDAAADHVFQHPGATLWATLTAQLDDGHRRPPPQRQQMPFPPQQ